MRYLKDGCPIREWDDNDDEYEEACRAYEDYWQDREDENRGN